MEKSIQKSGYFFAFLAIFIWSWNVIISRYLAPFVPPFQISFGRWVVAAIVILPFTFHQVWEHRKILKAHWKIIILLSIGIAFMNNFIYQAGHSTTAIDMSLLATTGPIFLIIFSWFLYKIRLSQKQIIGFIIAFIGVLIVISGGSIETIKNFNFSQGNLWMIVFALFFGAYGALEKKIPKDLSSISFLSVTITIGVIMLLPFFLNTLDTHPLSNIQPMQWGLIIYLGIVNSIFGYLFWNIALMRIGSLRCGLIYYSLPIFSSIEAMFVLNEQLAGAEIIGALLVFAGIISASIQKHS